MEVGLQVEAPRSQGLVPGRPFQQWSLPDGTVWTEFYKVGASFLLRFPELADFEMTEDGNEVNVWPVPGVSDATFRHLFLNQVVPLAISKQGRLVLHGSAVEIGGKSVAFIGESGRGKSTLAASFAISGFRFLTDDGLQLAWSAQGCLAMPSHPSIRLWEDSQAALLPQGIEPAPAVQFTKKARFMAGDTVRFCESALPLHRIYFLGNDAAKETRIRPMTSAAALIGLVKNSFLLDIEAQDMLAMHFDALSRLATIPLHFQIDYPRDFSRLQDVRAAIVEHSTSEVPPV